MIYVIFDLPYPHDFCGKLASFSIRDHFRELQYSMQFGLFVREFVFFLCSLEEGLDWNSIFLAFNDAVFNLLRGILISL